MGLSSIQGWGAFLKKDVEKNDFIGEYVGEILSSDEGNSRVDNYKKSDDFYMFDINNDQDLDGLRHGSKAKYVNHDPNPNVYQKCVLVKGDHKILFFAKQAMRAGTELTFNYKISEDEASTEESALSKPTWMR